MKLNIDLGYILKRLIVIGLGFILISQLKSCDVFAANIDITDMFYQNCRAVYDNNGSFAGVYGRPTLVDDPLQSYTSCRSNSFGTTRYNYIQYFISKSLLGSDAPVLVQNKKYNFTFYLRTSFESFSQSGQIGPNNITKVVFGIYNDVNSTYNSVCNIENLNDTIQDSHVIFHNYKVSCNNVTMGTYTSYTYLRLYVFIDSALSSPYNLPELVEVNNLMGFEESVTQADIQNDINDSDVSSASENGNSIFEVDENGQSTNSNVSNYGLESVITAPIQILERATDACSPLSFSIFQKTITLPCGDDLFWNRDFSSQSSIFSKGVSGNGLNSTRNTFRAFWNLFFGGAIIFHLLTILYEVCQKAIDPFDDTLYTISDAIDSRSRSSKLTGVEEVDMSNVQRNLNNYSIKKQASQQDAVVLGSVK